MKEVIMKINNYIKILSAVLIMFGYSNSNCNAQSINSSTTLTSSTNTKNGVKLQQVNELKTEFRKQEDIVSAQLKNKFNTITTMINSTFHLNKHKTQNKEITDNIKTFLQNELVYDTCDIKSAQKYYDAVKSLQAKIMEYIDSCQNLPLQDSQSKLSKVKNYVFYNAKNLNNLCGEMIQFTRELYSSIHTLYPMFENQITK